MTLLSLALFGCAGGGSVTFDDTSTTIDDTNPTTDDTSSTTDDTSGPDDTSKPDDTGEPQDGMEPDYVYFTQYWAVAEGKPTSWITDDGNELPPLALVYYYDERYFEAGDDQYVCLEYFQMQDPTRTDDGSWGVFNWTLNHIPNWTDDPCDFGAGPMEGKSLNLGVDHISEDMKGQLQQAIEGNGDDFSLWEPYLLGSRAGDHEVGWAILLELDENMMLVPGDNCPAESACRKAPEGDPDAVPGPSVVWGSSWYLVSPNEL